MPVKQQLSSVPIQSNQEESPQMKSRAIVAAVLCCMIVLFGFVQMHTQSVPASTVPYGDNKDAGNYAVLNGVRIYYETYGTGSPLILIHGNGGNIKGMQYQIEYFSRYYRVIAMDCRGRGKSELGKDSLTYMQMTKDVVSLLDLLHVDSTYVIGRSDGGIIGLLMGIYYPGRIKKIAAFGANLWPDTTALYPRELETLIGDRKQAEAMIAKHDTTKDWYLIQQRNRLMEFQPHISGNDLRRIQAPVLVLSCDRDVIKEEHTLFIYRNIPKGNLCIFPGETHWITGTNPNLFNSTVAKYFADPYKGEEIRK
jgi:pimeloyl-ACP methyl ester carboxylesterase